MVRRRKTATRLTDKPNPVRNHSVTLENANVPAQCLQGEQQKQWSCVNTRTHTHTEITSFVLTCALCLTLRSEDGEMRLAEAYACEMVITR